MLRLLALILLLTLGGLVVWAATWDTPPDRRTVETVLPDDALSR